MKLGGIQPTYEELKLQSPAIFACPVRCIQPTYEELKHELAKQIDKLK